MRWWWLCAVGLAGLACTGFMGELDYDGASAAQRLGVVTGSHLPSGVSQARVVETTGIDWLLEGEASAPRTEVDAWFATLTLPCGAPTTTVGVVPAPLFMLGQSGGWSGPSSVQWRGKNCTGATHSGPHHQVYVTDTGDPAWIRVVAMTM